MVYYDHNRIMASRGREISDGIDRELFEGKDSRGSDWQERRDSGMSVDFILLADGTAINEVFDKQGATRPPEITFEDDLSVKDTHVFCSGKRID